MSTPLTRRSFMQTSAIGLTGAVIAGGGSAVFGAVNSSKSGQLALLGGTPVRAAAFPATWPIFDKHEEQALLKALRSRNWCCLRGNAVYDFEKEFAEQMGVPQCILTNGGTTALRASLHSLGVGAGDEVITSPHTFIATINVITNAHALPVFVDIDPDTGSIDADQIEAAVTEHTRAILPIHLAGWPADIEKITAIAEKHDIPVVEDACQSVFSEVGGRKIGTFGATGCISFQEWKSLVCGEGGAILGRDPELMRRCAAFINNGRDPHKEKSGYPFPGSNHRMTEFQAAVLTEQFRRFKKQDRMRQRNGRYLEKTLTREFPGLSPRKRYNPDTRFTYVEFDLDYDRRHFKNVSAARFAEALRAEGIPVSGGPRRYGAACHREGMIEEHIRSRGFERVFGKARLDKYRQSLRKMPVIDNIKPSDKEKLEIDSKIVLLQPREEMDQIVEAFAKVARNVEKLA